MGKILKWIAQKVGWEWHVTCDLCGSRDIDSTGEWWCRVCCEVIPEDTPEYHRHRYTAPVRHCHDCGHFQHA